MLELFTPEFIEKLSPETLRGLGVTGQDEDDNLVCAPFRAEDQRLARSAPDAREAR